MNFLPGAEGNWKEKLDAACGLYAGLVFPHLKVAGQVGDMVAMATSHYQLAPKQYIAPPTSEFVPSETDSKTPVAQRRNRKDGKSTDVLECIVNDLIAPMVEKKSKQPSDKARSLSAYGANSLQQQMMKKQKKQELDKIQQARNTLQPKEYLDNHQNVNHESTVFGLSSEIEKVSENYDIEDSSEQQDGATLHKQETEVKRNQMNGQQRKVVGRKVASTKTRNEKSPQIIRRFTNGDNYTDLHYGEPFDVILDKSKNRSMKEKKKFEREGKYREQNIAIAKLIQIPDGANGRTPVKTAE